MSTRSVAKKCFKAFFLLLALPLYVAFQLLWLITRTDGCFASFSQALSLVPGKAGTYLRAAFYRLTCPGTSDEISVGFLTVLSHRDTTIRKGVYIGPQCNIGMCEIGENTLLGSGVHILSGNKQHDFTDDKKPIQDQGGSFDKVTIGSDCWIGNGAIVMCGISEKTIVAAGSVVTRTADRGAILAGNPARKLSSRYGNNAATKNDNQPINPKDNQQNDY